MLIRKRSDKHEERPLTLDLLRRFHLSFEITFNPHKYLELQYHQVPGTSCIVTSFPRHAPAEHTYRKYFQ